MRRAAVDRTARSVILLLAAAAAVFPFLVRDREPAREPLDAARVFERHCAQCHAEHDFVARLRTTADHVALEREWLEFLGEHGDTDASTDRALIERWSEQARGP